MLTPDSDSKTVSEPLVFRPIRNILVPNISNTSNHYHYHPAPPPPPPVVDNTQCSDTVVLTVGALYYGMILGAACGTNS